jgi:hypothetical protein
MAHRSRTLVLFALAALVALPASAGWSYRQSMHSTSDRSSRAFESATRAQIEGDDARIDFETTEMNAIFGAGSYMLLRSAAPKGMFVVSPSKEAYSRLDPDEMASIGAPMGEGMEGAGIGIEISDISMEKVLEEPGGTIEGLPTTHYRLKKRYVMTMSMANMRMPTLHEIVDDVWTTTAVAMYTAGSGTGKAVQQMGNSLLRGASELIEMELRSIQGFALKRVTVDHSTPQGKGMMAKMMGGKEQTTTTTILVTELQQVAIPASTFAIPAGYDETEFMAPGARSKAPGPEGEN